MAVPAAAAAVSLSTDASVITYGKTAHLTGDVSATAGCVASRAVDLQWRAADSSAWADLGHAATTASDGSFSIANGQAYDGRYRVRIEATASCTSLLSPSVAVRVRAYVDTALLAGSLEAGSCIDVDVTVSPAKPGQTVQLQRRRSTGWTVVQTLSLDADSKATASPCFGWADIGVVRLRARWVRQDSLNATATGITLAFRIEPAGWMRAIDEAIGGHSVSVSVAERGTTIFEHAPTARRTPASNEKLLLSMALLDRFAPDVRIPTIAAATVRHGVVRRNLWILGRGDPEGGRARMRALAGRLVAAGVRVIRGRVMGSTSYFRRDWWASGWPRSAHTYVAMPTALTFEHNVANGRDVRDPERRAAAALTTALERRGVRVRGRPGAGSPPAGVDAVAQVGSRPLRQLLARMDRPSDNFYAEVLGKGLGAARAGPPGTIAKAANAIEAFTSAHGVAFSLHDASGLSYRDRVTARGIVTLLAYATTAPWGAVLRRALPWGGVGTLEDRLHDVVVRAKTGTLDGISALSGWVRLQHDDRWGEFSILSSGVSKSTAVRIEDRIVRILSVRGRR
jgi:D-alanyl-D-alanine carboxypeptidase